MSLLDEIKEIQDYFNETKKNAQWRHIGLPMSNYTDDYPAGKVVRGHVMGNPILAGAYKAPRFNSLHAKDTIFISNRYPLKQYSVYQPIGLNQPFPTNTLLHEIAHSLQYMIQNPAAKRYLDTLSATLQYLDKLDHYGAQPGLSNKVPPTYINYPGEPEVELVANALERKLSDIRDSRYSLVNYLLGKNIPASVLSKNKPIKMQNLNEDLYDLSDRLADVLLNYPTIRSSVYYHGTPEHIDNVREIQQEMDKRLAVSLGGAASSGGGTVSPGGNIFYKIIEGIAPSTEKIIGVLKFIKDAPRPGTAARDYLTNAYQTLSQKEDEKKRKEKESRDLVSPAVVQVPTLASTLVDLWNKTHKKVKK